jgi:predicted nucleotidyltransferase
MIMPQLIALIHGLPEGAQQKLMGVFEAQPLLQEVWLYGSRAVGRELSGSDVDLCLKGRALDHGDLLRLMASVDDLLLPWQVDLALRRQLSDDLMEQINRHGRCIWSCP